MTQYTNLPNFLIAGAPRSGSTSLFEVLKKSESVFMPENKEPHFFAANCVGKGPRGLGQATVDSWSAYLRLFEGVAAREAWLRGECSIGYLNFHQQSIPNIKRRLGNEVKIVLILREPIERAFSSYVLHRMSGTEDLPFLDAVSEKTMAERREKGHWFGFDYVGVSRYASGVESFFSEFVNVHVIIFEDFIRDPKSVYQELFDFLEIPDAVPATTVVGERHNKANIPWSPLFSKALKRLSRKVPPMGKLCSGINRLSSFRPRLSGMEREALRYHFYEDVSRLRKVLGRNLSEWQI